MNFGNFNQNKIENPKSHQNFFDDYPEFFRGEGRNNPFPNRLNNRYIALIEANKNLIYGKKIFDIASHDGRWSFAALKTGASQVLGIELFPKMVRFANETMEKNKITKERYQFVVGDIHHEIKKINQEFDTVFCFGFLYHTMYHMELFEEIKRLNPKHIIIDTHITLSDLPSIQIKTEKIGPSRIKAKIYPNANEEIIVGWLSKSALELMLRQIGYDCKYYDWHNKGIKNWKHMKDYQSGERIALVAKRFSR